MIYRITGELTFKDLENLKQSLNEIVPSENVRIKSPEQFFVKTDSIDLEIYESDQDDHQLYFLMGGSISVLSNQEVKVVLKKMAHSFEKYQILYTIAYEQEDEGRNSLGEEREIRHPDY